MNAYGDSTAISGPLKPGLNQRNICVMAYPFAACADWLVGCSRHPVSSLLARSIVCSKVLTHLGAGSCAGLLPIHAGM